MSKAAKTLHTAATRLWAGSQDHLVAVYTCAEKSGDRSMPLYAAATISSLLQGDPAERRGTMAHLRAMVSRCESTRRGAKADRHAAALVALDALDAMLEAP